jgi:hypothetical protein
MQQDVPAIWLRSFFGFSPEEDGYIGWSKEVNRQHILSKASTGDLMMIYGAGSASTSSSDILRVLGFLQIETTPIREIKLQTKGCSANVTTDGKTSGVSLFRYGARGG